MPWVVPNRLFKIRRGLSWAKEAPTKQPAKHYLGVLTVLNWGKSAGPSILRRFSCGGLPQWPPGCSEGGFSHSGFPTRVFHNWKSYESWMAVLTTIGGLGSSGGLDSSDASWWTNATCPAQFLHFRNQGNLWLLGIAWNSCPMSNLGRQVDIVRQTRINVSERLVVDKPAERF